MMVLPSSLSRLAGGLLRDIVRDAIPTNSKLSYQSSASLFLRGFASTPAPDQPPKGIPYANLSIGVPRETAANEKRVALTPAGVAALLKAGFKSVHVESGAGAGSMFGDDAYKAAGATIVDTKDALAQDVVLKVRPPAESDVGLLKPNARLVSFLYPAQNKALLDVLAAQKVTVLAMDQIPRTLSRAQTYDALSSMANIAGVWGVVGICAMPVVFLCVYCLVSKVVPIGRTLNLACSVFNMVNNVVNNMVSNMVNLPTLCCS